ncbi:MAG TPA: organic hydroperoxide resistance protein [Acidimicrobiales bacterium]|jgi:Ohr subfamily peroxiredoxin|nr:organic hydroperoxide resistance protein [Acidimicrobiales bacterium]
MTVTVIVLTMAPRPEPGSRGGVWGLDEGGEEKETTVTTLLNKPLYTAEATTKGGRDGHGRSSDGFLDLDIRPPAEMGGTGGGTNPEQLFALGYSACFQSAMAVVARRMGEDTSDSEVTGRVTIGTIGNGGFGLAVELDVHIPGVDEPTARKIVDAAHEVCPYSNATRGNIEVTLKLV